MVRGNSQLLLIVVPHTQTPGVAVSLMVQKGGLTFVDTESQDRQGLWSLFYRSRFLPPMECDVLLVLPHPHSEGFEYLCGAAPTQAISQYFMMVKFVNE